MWNFPEMTKGNPPPHQVALCAGYVAVQAEMEVLVLKLDALSESKPQEESTDTKKGCSNNKADSLLVQNHKKINIGKDLLN